MEKMTTSWAETVDFTKDLGEDEADPNAARAMNAAAAAATPIRRPSNAIPTAGEAEMQEYGDKEIFERTEERPGWDQFSFYIKRTRPH